MATPIVEKDAVSRTVYFPSVSWFNYHTGEEHQANSEASVSCNLTDLVPLFIRSGIIVARNDAKDVTRLKQLTNTF